MNAESSLVHLKKLLQTDKYGGEKAELNARLKKVDSLLFPADETSKSGKELIPLYIEKTELEYAKSSYSSAFRFCDSAITNIARLNLEDEYLSELVSLYLQQGETAIILGRYVEGISYMYDLLRMRKGLTTETYARAYLLLAKMYLRMNKIDMSLKCLRKTQILLPAIKGQERVDIEYELNISLSSVFIQKGEFAKALTYIESAEKLEGVKNKMKIYWNLSMLHLSLEEYDKAENFCIKAIELCDKPYDRAVLTNNCAIIFYLQEKYDDALDLCRTNELNIDSIDAAHVKGQLYAIFADIYQADKNYELALHYRQKEQALLDSLSGTNDDDRLLQLNCELETEKIKNEKLQIENTLKIAELSNSRKNYIILLLVVVVILVAVLVAFIVKEYKKRNRRLHAQNESYETDIRKKKEEFEIAISDKSRRLTVNALYLAKVAETAQGMISAVDRLQKECATKNARDIISTLRTDISSLLTQADDFDDFKLQFENVHPSFFVNLYKVHPNLTNVESRLCAFIVMNLSTKEIALLTNRSVRTIETSKFRLRKKLNLDKEVTLAEYLHNFLSSEAGLSSDS